MNSNLNQNILFLGNRATKISARMQLKELGIGFSTLTFNAALPFLKEKNSLLADSNLLKIDCDYSIEELKNELIELIQTQQLNGSFKLIIGDPSEILYQAFGSALLETQLYNQRASHEVHLWLYPMGMTSLDIRKELAQFIYKLKKNETQVLLLRKNTNESIELLNTLITKIDLTSFYELEEKMDGLEYLIGKQSANLIDG